MQPGHGAISFKWTYLTKVKIFKKLVQMKSTTFSRLIAAGKLYLIDKDKCEGYTSV